MLLPKENETASGWGEHGGILTDNSQIFCSASRSPVRLATGADGRNHFVIKTEMAALTKKCRFFATALRPDRGGNCGAPEVFRAPQSASLNCSHADNEVSRTGSHSPNAAHRTDDAFCHKR